MHYAIVVPHFSVLEVYRVTFLPITSVVHREATVEQLGPATVGASSTGTINQHHEDVPHGRRRTGNQPRCESSSSDTTEIRLLLKEN